MTTDGEPFEIDVLAAALRADAGDVGAFVEQLAIKLEDILPRRAKVDRARRGLLGPKLVRTISVDLGDARLELARGEGEIIETRRAKVSGGIVLKRETLDADVWLAALAGAMAAEAGRSEQARLALERLLIR